MVEDRSEQTNFRGICRASRCRVMAVAALLLVAGLLVWWLSAGENKDMSVPLVSERASSLLPGVSKPDSPALPAMASPSAAAPQLPGLDVMADKLAKRLAQEPADGEGWALLARTYLELGDVAKADAAYAKALALRPGDQAMKADYTAARKALQPPSR